MSGYSQILCPVDFSDESGKALAYAGAAARWYGAQLTVLHVVPELPLADVIPSLALVGAVARTPAPDHRRLERAAERFVREAIPTGVPFNVRLVEERDTTAEIANEARDLGVDLIVMASHPRDGLDRVLNPSVAEGVVRSVTCPVLVLPAGAAASVPPGDVAFDQIVCALDFSDESVSVLAAAVGMAEDADAHLVLLNVVEVPAELRAHGGSEGVNVAWLRAADVAERLRHLRQMVPGGARTYCRVETMVSEGKAGEEILRVAAEQNADLVVIGARGHNALDRLVFGSSAREVLHRASCPVLLAR